MWVSHDLASVRAVMASPPTNPRVALPMQHDAIVRADQTLPVMRAARSRAGGKFGPYEVIAPLAKGGMATVYLAEHHTSGERVALKVLEPQLATNPEVTARLFAEHALASRAHHANVVEIHAARFARDGVPYLVMEHCEGSTLAELAREGLSLSAIVAICAQVASGLAAMHAAGVIHCDVKHDNVLVRVDDGALRVKVIDFGVSRAVDEPATAGEAIAGTPWCMAPEQWAGTPLPASDVYALGCLLYELTTGTPPFDGSLPELMTAHLEQRPARPSWLAPMPIELERTILRALAKDPAARPTMLAMADDLFARHDALTSRALCAG
jgi:serine/threonine protein kinase